MEGIRKISGVVRPSYLGVCLFALRVSLPVYAADYQYTAVTQASAVARQGAVRAGSLTWQCKGNRCTIKGPWLQPGIQACQALAAAVGRLRSYGRPGAQLNAAQVAQCNRSVKSAPTVASRKARPAPPVNPAPSKKLSGKAPQVVVRAPIDKNAVKKAAGAAAASGKVPIQTGGGHTAPSVVTPGTTPSIATGSVRSTSRSDIPLTSQQRRTIESSGPTIQIFEKIRRACPYPDPDADILHYEVATSPNGKPVSKVEIFGTYTEYAVAGSRNLIYSTTSPGQASSGVLPPNLRLPGSPAPSNVQTVANSGINADNWPYSTFTLVATDAGGRTSSRSIPWTYWRPTSLAYFSQEPLQTGDPPDQAVVARSSSVKHYLHMNIGNISVGRIMIVVRPDDGPPESATEVTLLHGSHGSIWRLPTEYIDSRQDGSRMREVTIEYTDHFRLSPDGIVDRLDSSVSPHARYEVNVEIVPYRPSTCSRNALVPPYGAAPLNQTLHYTAHIPQPPQPPPPPPPTSDPQRYLIHCTCEHFADSDRTERELADVEVHACTSEGLGIQASCVVASGRLNDTNDCKPGPWMCSATSHEVDESDTSSCVPAPEQVSVGDVLRIEGDEVTSSEICRVPSPSPFP